jgi:hypothetical protein
MELAELDRVSWNADAQARFTELVELAIFAEGTRVAERNAGAPDTAFVGRTADLVGRTAQASRILALGHTRFSEADLALIAADAIAFDRLAAIGYAASILTQSPCFTALKRPAELTGRDLPADREAASVR